MSFMKLFKPSKKNGNKENLPSISRGGDRSSARHASESFSFRPEDVYTGEQRHVPNPYSVVTAPKMTKGPRSCPGAPVDFRPDRQRDSMSMISGENPLRDRHSRQNAPVRYHAHSNKRYSPDEYRDGSRNDNLRRSFYESYAESDEDDVRDEKIRHLESKLSKMKRAYHDDTKNMQSQVSGIREDCQYYRQQLERQRQVATTAKETAAREQKKVSKLMRELHLANQRIDELEQCLAEAENPANESSLLVCSSIVDPNSQSFRNQSLHSTEGGAGEALCGMDSRLDMGQASTPSISAYDDRDELDQVDEVRVFRTAISDVESLSDPETSAEPVEEPRSVSPQRENNMCMAKKLLATPGHRPPRSLSDTDLRALVRLEDSDQKTSTGLSREASVGTMRRFSSKEHFVRYATSSDSSDDETARLIERQLRKKGGQVRFNPPRAHVHPRCFRKFGKNERSALAEFEYLQDLSTDASGMLSSPDCPLPTTMEHYQNLMALKNL